MLMAFEEHLLRFLQVDGGAVNQNTDIFSQVNTLQTVQECSARGSKRCSAATGQAAVKHRFQMFPNVQVRHVRSTLQNLGSWRTLMH